ncbi:MAG: hypothetical protein ACE5KT_07670, partial [Methanosarcinales archaeon]
MLEEYPEVIQEDVDRREFTNREQILKRLYDWAIGIAEYRSRSILLAAPRRYGKTAVLQRLYNILFWKQDKVAPFYYAIQQKEYTMEVFAKEYLLTFLKQYIGFQLRDADIASSEKISFEDLIEISKKNNMNTVAEYIQAFLKLEPIENNWSRMFDFAQEAPSYISFRDGTFVAVILDEFQALDDRVYDNAEKTILNKSITSSYQPVCSKKSAPMLISGSLVTIITRKLSGPLAGRFGRINMPLMSEEDCIKLAFKLSEAHNIPITFSSAKLIAEISLGNPFYVWCVFVSEYKDKDLSTVEGVEKTYQFEIGEYEGHINDFWREHFNINMDLLNDSPEDRFGLTKQIIFFILQQKDKKVTIKDIAKQFGISYALAYEKMDNLLKADLVVRSSYGVVSNLKDRMLEKVLRLEFGTLITDLEDVIIKQQVKEDFAKEVEVLRKRIKSMQGYINTLLGEEAELMLRRVMTRFKNQIVDGKKYFNVDGEITLPKFDRKPTSLEIEGYQIDLLAKKTTSKKTILWMLESKNTET